MHHKRQGNTNFGTVAGVFSSPVCAFWGTKVQLLLDHGADVNVANHVGETVVSHAFRAADKLTVDMLLRAGADNEEAQIAGSRLQSFETFDRDKIDDLGVTAGWSGVAGKPPQTVPGGGWDAHDNKAGRRHEIQHCDIDRRDELTPAEFMSEYVIPMKPVVLGPKVLKGSWPAAHEWSKQRLRSAFGDMPVTGDTIDQTLSKESKAKLRAAADGSANLAGFIDSKIDGMEHSGVPGPT